MVITRNRLTLVLALWSLLVSGCGSTVAPDDVEVAAGTTADSAGMDMGLGPPVDSAGAGAGAGPGATLDTPRSRPGDSRGVDQEIGDPSPGTPDEPRGNDPKSPSGRTSPSGKRPVAPGVPGVSDDEMVIGLSYAEDAAEANEAMGGEGVTTGDERRNYEALIDWFNERGGLAGRRLKPVYHRFSNQSATPKGAQLQAACSTFTEDNAVFVVMTANVDDSFLQCMHRYQVGLIGYAGFTNSDARTFQQFPRWLETNTLSLSAAANLTPIGQEELGFFKTAGPVGARLGVLTYDHPRFRRALEQELLPSLARLGHKPVDVRYAKYEETLSDVAQTSSDVSNAVLSFRSNDVTHVMILDGQALLTILFMRQAENQGYRPAYGLNSQNGGQIVVDSGVAPPEQFRKATLVGWSQDDDVVREQRRTWRARRQCEKIYDQAGIQFGDDNARVVGYLNCDSFFFARAAIEATRGPLSADTFVQGATALGNRYESPVIGPTAFGPGKRYGVSRYNLARYFDDCGCFRYVSRWRAVP